MFFIESWTILTHYIQQKLYASYMQTFPPHAMVIIFYLQNVLIWENTSVCLYSSSCYGYYFLFTERTDMGEYQCVFVFTDNNDRINQTVLLKGMS